MVRVAVDDCIPFVRDSDDAQGPKEPRTFSLHHDLPWSEHGPAISVHGRAGIERDSDMDSLCPCPRPSFRGHAAERRMVHRRGTGNLYLGPDPRARTPVRRHPGNRVVVVSFRTDRPSDGRENQCSLDPLQFVEGHLRKAGEMLFLLFPLLFVGRGRLFDFFHCLLVPRSLLFCDVSARWKLASRRSRWRSPLLFLDV